MDAEVQQPVQPAASAPPETSSATREFGDFLDDPKNYVADDFGSEFVKGDAGEGGDNSDDKPAEPGNPQQTSTYDPAIFKDVKKPEVRSLMEMYAKDSELDLNNPRDFKLARQLAEKEQTNRELKLSSEPSPEVKSYLDAFNDPEPGQPAETPQQPELDEKELPSFVKVARGWKNPLDFSESMEQVFEMDPGPERKQALADVMIGLQDRTFHELFVPVINRMIASAQQQQLGPVLQEVETAREYQDRIAIVETWAKTPGMEDIHELFENASDGVIEVEGEEVPDTWLNRILAANPFILNSISIKGKSPAESKRKTMAEQYRVAHQLMKAQRAGLADPTKASGFIRVGQAIEKSKRDPVRTAINSPSGKVPAGGRKQSMFESGSPSGEMSMANLFSSR